MIRLPNLDLNTLTLKSAMLVTGQDAVQKWIHNLLQVKISKDIFPSGVKGKTHIAKFPVFDRLHDPICRAMLAVALGCDAFIGGLDKFGPANGICNKKTAGLTGLPRQEEISEAIVKFRSKTRIDKRSLLCYARAIAFEITGDGYTLEAYKDADPELLFKIYLSEIFVERSEPQGHLLTLWISGSCLESAWADSLLPTSLNFISSTFSSPGLNINQ